MKPAVFLDRDGVLVEDTGLLAKPAEFRILEGVAQALAALRRAGFCLLVATNQTVVARGLATEEEVRLLHRHLEWLLREAGAPGLDGWYFCPHHPQATLPVYRVVCDCRKPRAGLLLRAAQEMGLDLSASYVVGDRITDIVAGATAGCRTVLVQTGKHLDAPIQTSEPFDTSLAPDHTCADLPAAADWILKTK